MRQSIQITDIDDLRWESQGIHGIQKKQLSLDPETNAETMYIHIPENWKGGGVAHYHSCSEEVYIISGDVTLDGKDYLIAGSYLYRPSRVVHGFDESAKQGCRCIIKMGGSTDFNLVHKPKQLTEYPIDLIDDSRDHIVHFRTPTADWKPSGTGKSALGIKILSQDRDTGGYTALIKLPAGWSGSLGTDRSRSREWFMIDGTWQLDNGKTFQTLGYSYQPPGTRHPNVVKSTTGCTVLTWMC